MEDFVVNAKYSCLLDSKLIPKIPNKLLKLDPSKTNYFRREEFLDFFHHKTQSVCKDLLFIYDNAMRYLCVENGKPFQIIPIGEHLLVLFTPSKCLYIHFFNKIDIELIWKACVASVTIGTFKENTIYIPYFSNTLYKYAAKISSKYLFFVEKCSEEESELFLKERGVGYSFCLSKDNKCRDLPMYCHVRNHVTGTAHWNVFEQIRQLKFKSLYIHSITNVNFAVREKQYKLNKIVEDIRGAVEIGAKGAVVNVVNYDLATNNKIYENLKYLAQFATQKSKLILKFCMTDSRLDEIENLLKMFSKEEQSVMGICVDTCDLFAYGFNVLESISILEEYSDMNISLICLNDSASVMCSMNTTGEKFGMGYIGQNEMLSIADYCMDNRMDMVSDR